MIIEPIRTYLMSEFFRDEAESSLSEDQSLISSGLLDSVSTLKLVLFLEQQFNVEVDSMDIVSGKLDTLKSIESLIQAKRSKG
jgi:acyl carrier protein